MKVTATPETDKFLCKLKWGTHPNPTLIEITGFDEIRWETNATYVGYAGKAFEIHFPKIFNPSVPWELLTVSVSIEKMSGFSLKKILNFLIIIY